MTAPFPHLTPNAAEKLALTNEERIAHILKPRWIGYPHAQRILDELEDLLSHPKQVRMPNMLLVGETNNGKTMLVNHFLQAHPADPNPEGEAIRAPVLYVQAPPGPDERGLYNAILLKLFKRQRPSESTDQKRDRVVALLKQIELGMIIIDEIHHLLAGPLLKQRNFLNVMKYLGNELCVPIVGAGTADAVRAIQIDPQVQNRFVPSVLPKWELNADFARLLMSFERVIPLKHSSDLAAKETAAQILARSGGTIGEISQLINQAAIWAIKHGHERIDGKGLTSCRYIPPSDRKMVAARL